MIPQYDFEDCEINILVQCEGFPQKQSFNRQNDKPISRAKGGADLQRRQKAVISRMDAISSTCHYQIGLQGPTNLRTGGGKYPWRAVSCILLN